MEAYKLVSANKGGPGIDDKTINEFEADLENNLYKLWNRMSSGSYFPKPVKGVEIPKKTGGVRLLGVPTVEDRIAQMVARMNLEPLLEPIFCDDSYGYRPNKSAIDAIKITRERCWKYDWLIEFDIKGLFDNIDHELLMKAVRKHTDSKWVILYIERWLKAPIQMPNGTTSQRVSGTPQGSIVSPILANLFMHYAFDRWMKTKNPHNPWARYADDGVIHCKTKEEAQYVLKKLTERMRECKLEIRPEKTAIIYCRDVNRKEEHDNTSFDFLGYTFRTRVSRNRNGQYFASFSPAVSKTARKAFRDNIRDIRKGSSHKSLEQMAKEMNPVLRGWANYFGNFRPSEMRNELIKVNLALVCWAIRKYKGLKRHKSKALNWLGRCAKTRPDLFYHWEIGLRPAA